MQILEFLQKWRHLMSKTQEKTKKFLKTKRTKVMLIKVSTSSKMRAKPNNRQINCYRLSRISEDSPNKQLEHY